MLMRAVDSYLEVRRAAGFVLRVPERQLRSFVRFAHERGETHVRAATAVAWAVLVPSMTQRDSRLKAVIRFARHARAEDASHEVPPDHVFAAPRLRRLPHIFPAEQLRQILEEAGRLGPEGSLRPRTYQTLFGLLAACGLRISEALALRFDDVTDDGVIIRETKFRKTRLVPMHTTTEYAMRSYLRCRRKVGGATDHLFISLRGRPLPAPSAVAVFLAILRKLGLRGPPGEPGPHLHDLRHYPDSRVIPTERAEIRAYACLSVLPRDRSTVDAG
jgi:integrase